jgi:hypothetical protein
MTTTVAEIRATMADTIRALTPTGIITPRFTAWQEDTLRTPFRLWAEKNPLAAFRRFSLRVLPGVEPAGVHDYSRRRETARLECVVAYPMDHRYGALGAVSLDTILAADMALIVDAIGTKGYATISPAADAVVTDEGHTVEDIEACRFGVAVFTAEYYRSTT